MLVTSEDKDLEVDIPFGKALFYLPKVRTYCASSQEDETVTRATACKLYPQLLQPVNYFEFETLRLHRETQTQLS